MSIIQAQTLFNRQAKTILDIVSMSKLYYYLICLNNRIFDILFNARVVIRRHCSWTVARAQQKRVSLFRYYVTSGLPRKRPVPTHTQKTEWDQMARLDPFLASVSVSLPWPRRNNSTARLSRFRREISASAPRQGHEATPWWPIYFGMEIKRYIYTYSCSVASKHCKLCHQPWKERGPPVVYVVFLL